MSDAAPEKDGASAGPKKPLPIALILGALFVCLNMPFTEAMLESMLPYAKSSSSAMLICKTAAFVILMFIVQNYHLVS